MSYAQGGAITPSLTMARNDTGKPERVYTPIQLSRGVVVMSQASIDALSPGMLRRLAGDVDIISAEDALAELDAEDDDS